ncbi:Head domain of trimeric autotransporter adhesin, partial [Pasteurella testudinis DSM 23072]
MNKVYKVIWNKVTQAFVVVSELATARGKAASESNGDVIECAVNRELFSHFIFSLKVSVVAVTVALFGSNAFAYQVNGSGAPTTDPNNVTNVVIGGGSGANQATKVVNGGDRSTIIGAGAKGIAADDWRAEGATAIGAGAQATGGATALGWNAKVSNTTGGVAVGSDTRVSGANAIAMGWAAQSSASDAIAIGTQAVAALSQSTNTNQGGNISIGAHAYSSNFGPSSQIIADRTDGGELSFRNTNGQMVTNMLPSAVSIGEYSKAYAGGTAVGYNNIAGIEGQEGAMAFAFGNNNDATGFYSTALGAANKATGPSAITLGVANSADGNTAVAIGRQVTASGQYSTALGNIATASGDNAFAVGHSSQATGNRAIAIGSSTATDSNLALATATQATSTDAIAVGTNTKASGDYSLALGRAAQATNDSSTALGNNAKAQHRNTLALGNTSTASGANSVAAGYASSATATNSVAVGSSAKAAGAASIALGNSASASGTNAIAMGSSSTTSGVAAIAIGDASNAAVRGVSIGEKASSNASSVAIGENAKASVSVGDVAIGKNSATTAATQVSTATVNGVTYSGFAGSAPTNAFSVGSAGAERQIQNVAAGRITATSTDAINGSQLYAVAEVAGKGWNIQANGGTASKVAPGDTVNFIDGSGTTAAVTSANGTSTVSYSVNKSGLTVADNGVVSAQTAGDNFATADDVAKAINSANKTTVVAAGNNVTVNDPVVNGTVTTYTVNADGTSVSAGSAVQVTKGEKDSTTNMTDYAVDLTDATKEDIKKGVDAATDIAQKGLTFTGDNDSKTDVKKLGETVAVTGDENIVSTASATGIALALSKNLTVDSVTTGNTTMNNDGITIANGENPVSLTNTGLNNGGNTITNVADGVNGTDAVNKSQLDTVENKADNNTTDIANLQNQTWKLQANSDEPSAVKANDTVRFIDGENIDISRDGNNITIATAKEVNFDKATVGTGANQVVLDDNGVNVGGKTYISKDGIDANNQVISNVASGGDVNSNAANIGDVKNAAAAAKSEVTAGTNVASVTSTVGENKQTVYTVNADGASVSAAEGSAVSVAKTEKNSTTNVTDYVLDLTQTTKDDIQKGVDAKSAVDSNGLIFTADNNSKTNEKLLGSEVAINGDDNITTTATADGVNITLNKALSVDSVTAGNTVVNNSGVTINGGANNPVSLTNNGLNNGGNTITNVASGGTTPTNAANIGDVQTAAAAAKSEVKAGTNVASVDESKGDNNQTVYTVNANGAKTSAGSTAVTVAAGTPDTNNVTDYKVDLSDSSKESLAKADTALQSWTAQVNGAEAKVVDKDNANVNFVNGSNIEITAEADGEIKVSTAKAVTFDSVTINNGGSVTEGSKSAVNGGDVYNAIQNSESQFTGDNGEIVKRKPADILTLKGGATESTENNIQTIANTDGSIAIQLAKSVSGLSSISTEKLTVGDKVEITEEGINAGNTVISNVASGGTTTTNAANIGDVQTAAAAAKSEVKNGTNVTSVVETKGEGGRSIYTVNADGASVSAAAESAVQVTKGEKNTETNVTDYAVDLTDATKADIKKGVEAATDIAEKGLTFTGDNDSKTDVKKLGETVAVTGDNNITTTAGTDGITLALNPNLNVTSVTAGNTTLNDAGVTIKSPTAENPANTVSLTNTGLNNGGNKITNVAAGEDATDAVNKSQLDALKDTITAGEKSTVVEQGNNTTVTSAVDGNVTTYTVNAEKTTVSQGNGITVTAGETDESGVTDYEVA